MVTRLGQGPADPVYLINTNEQAVDSANPLPVSQTQPIQITDEWTVTLLPDEAVGNAKVFDVPAGTEYQVLWIYVEYTSDANAGDRQLEIDIRDNAGDIIGQIRTGQVQAASLTRIYMFGPSLADLFGFRDTDYLMTPFPPTVFLPAFYSIRVFDNNAVSALDTLNVQMMVARRNA